MNLYAVLMCITECGCRSQIQRSEKQISNITKRTKPKTNSKHQKVQTKNNKKQNAITKLTKQNAQSKKTMYIMFVGVLAFYHGTYGAVKWDGGMRGAFK